MNIDGPLDPPPGSAGSATGCWAVQDELFDAIADHASAPGESRQETDGSVVLVPTAIYTPGASTSGREVFSTFAGSELSRDLVMYRADGTVEVIDRDQMLREPVQRLNEALAEVLDYEAHPDRGPEETIALINDAMTTFVDDTVDWDNRATG